MKQIELTSKLVLVIIGLTSVSAILVPTYAVPTIKSADIFDETIQSVDIKNGEVKNADLANNAVTSGKILDKTILATDIADGVISSGTGNLEITQRQQEGVAGTSEGSAEASCNPDEKVTGGGFELSSPDLFVAVNKQVGNTWHVNVENPTDQELPFIVYAECAKITP
jgi:hypothetical protein